MRTETLPILEVLPAKFPQVQYALPLEAEPVFLVRVEPAGSRGGPSVLRVQRPSADEAIETVRKVVMPGVAVRVIGKEGGR